jgi:hypothetical protein
MNNTIKIIMTQDGPVFLSEDAHGILRPEIPTLLSVEGWDELSTLLEKCSVDSVWMSDGWEFMTVQGSTISIYELLKPLEGSNEEVVTALCDAMDMYIRDYAISAVNASYDANILCWRTTASVKLEAQVQEIVISKDCYGCGADLGEWVDVSNPDEEGIYLNERILCEECREIQQEKIRKRISN